MNLPVIIIGAGGHCKVLLDTLILNHIPITGITDSNPEAAGSSILGISLLGGDDTLRRFPPESVKLVNGLGSVGVPSKRKEIFEKFKLQGYSFASVIHPSAVVAKDVELSEGVQVMAGVVIQSGTKVGENTILNTKSSVDHDCNIGAHIHVAPGVTISGGVKIGESTHIGTGAVVIQNIQIGHHVLIAAGSVVTQNLSNRVKVRGLPAREF